MSINHVYLYFKGDLLIQGWLYIVSIPLTHVYISVYRHVQKLEGVV